MGKTMIVYGTFLRDVGCQKLLNSANVSKSYSQNNTGTAFFETRCIYVGIYLFFGDTPTGQTPRRIFTRDGSNDAVSGKGVPFGG